MSIGSASARRPNPEAAAHATFPHTGHPNVVSNEPRRSTREGSLL
jgi:hypothetical protein